MAVFKKKSTKIIFIISVVFIVIAIAVTTFVICYKNAEYDAYLQKKSSVENGVIYSTGCTVELMQFLDKEGISIDESVRNKYKKLSIKIFDDIYEKNLNAYSMTYLALINSYFNLGKDEYIKSLFDRFYSEKYHLLRGKIDISDDEADNETILEDNSYWLIPLRRSGFDMSDYGIEEKLIKEYNKYIKQDFIGNEDTERKLSDIMMYFFYTDQIDKIDYIKMKSYYIDYNGFYDVSDKKESLGIYFDDVSSINCFLRLFNNDKSYSELTDKTYLELSSDEDFSFFGDASDFQVVLNTVGYSYIDCVNQNKYFTDNVNRWMDEVYENNIKEISKVWLGKL